MSKGEPTDGAPMKATKRKHRRKDVYIIPHPFENVNFFPKGCFYMTKHNNKTRQSLPTVSLFTLTSYLLLQQRGKV